MIKTERHVVAFIVGILLGALVASLATLLMTPSSGTETRSQLSARLGVNDADKQWPPAA